MTEKSVFISSCSRREFARRRSDRGVWRADHQLLLIVLLVVLVVGLGGFIAGHGGL